MIKGSPQAHETSVCQLIMSKTNTCNRGMVARGNKGARGLGLWFQRNMPINFPLRLTGASTPFHGEVGLSSEEVVNPSDVEVTFQASRVLRASNRRDKRLSRGRKSREIRNRMRFPLRGAFLAFQAKQKVMGFFSKKKFSWIDERENAKRDALRFSKSVRATLEAVPKTLDVVKEKTNRNKKTIVDGYDHWRYHVDVINREFYRKEKAFWHKHTSCYLYPKPWQLGGCTQRDHKGDLILGKRVMSYCFGTHTADGSSECQSFHKHNLLSYKGIRERLYDN